MAPATPMSSLWTTRAAHRLEYPPAQDIKGAIGNALAAKGNCEGADTAINVQALNDYSGLFNGAGNANNIGTGSALNIGLANSAQGSLNFSGNTNVVNDCRTIPDDEAAITRAQNDGYTVSDGTFYNPAGPGDEGQTQRIACKPTGDSTSIAINNHATGIGNGSGNANSFGGAASKTELENNTFNGDFNASGNGNGAAAFNSEDAGAIGSKAIIENNFMAGTGNGSGNGNGAVIADGGNCNSVYVEDNSEGAPKATVNTSASAASTVVRVKPS